jgi:hypothetical protein
MAEKVWIRRDRDTGYLMEVSQSFVKAKIQSVYKDVNLALKHATKDNCLTTGFADYYPKD